MTALEGKEPWSLPPPAPVSQISDTRSGRIHNLLKLLFIPDDITKIPRTSSIGTVSSNEDADEKDGNDASFEPQSELSNSRRLNVARLKIVSTIFYTLLFLDINGMDADVVSARPFRNIGLSKAAQTHRLRKLRTPAKCRECDSYVYFQGAECEEVGPSSQLLAGAFRRSDHRHLLCPHSASWPVTSAVWRRWPSSAATRSCRVASSCSAGISLRWPAVPATASPSSSPSASPRSRDGRSR